MSSIKRLMEEYPLNRIPRMTWEGKLYPYRPFRSMDTANKASRDVELVTMPYACFSVKLQEVTFGTINDALEKAYLMLRANPQYLFCSKQDYEKIDAEIDRCTNYRVSVHANWVRTPHTKYVNQTTGKLMSIITLPELEDGTLLFGFFTY